MDGRTVKLYKNMVEWERKKSLRYEAGNIYLGDSLIAEYRFLKTITSWRATGWRIQEIPVIGGYYRKNILLERLSGYGNQWIRGRIEYDGIGYSKR